MIFVKTDAKMSSEFNIKIGRNFSDSAETYKFLGVNSMKNRFCRSLDGLISKLHGLKDFLFKY